MDDISRTQSSSLAGLLRHNAGSAVEIDREGWADVDAAVAAVASRKNVARLGVPFDRATLLRLVTEDEKGRYELSGDGKRIRAVSGHSIEVELPLVPFEPDGPLWFGTVGARADEIAAEGLTKGARKTVRLSCTEEEAVAVAEGRVANSTSRTADDLGGPVVFEVDAPAMAAGGAEFFLNPAGEVVTPSVPAAFLSLRAASPTP